MVEAALRIHNPERLKRGFGLKKEYKHTPATALSGTPPIGLHCIRRTEGSSQSFIDIFIIRFKVCLLNNFLKNRP